MYYARIKKFIGEYAAEMGGVDLLVHDHKAAHVAGRA